ncbi:putative 50S ribosomal protein L23 chloroplastic [Bienertia sinuspersici]
MGPIMGHTMHYRRMIITLQSSYSIHLLERKNVDIEAWVHISTSMNENTKTESKNYQIVDKMNRIVDIMDKKGLLYSTISKKETDAIKKKPF